MGATFGDQRLPAIFGDILGPEDVNSIVYIGAWRIRQILMLGILFMAALRSFVAVVHNPGIQSPALLCFDYRDRHIFYPKCLAS